MIPTVDIKCFFNDRYKDFDFIPFIYPEAKYVNGNISEFEMMVICLICKNLNPDKVLEFGTFNGRTTINIASNIPSDGLIITVDLPKDKLNKTKYPLEGISKSSENDELGYVGKKIKLYNRYPIAIKSKIHQMWMDTAEFPVKEYQHYFDFIFVDASHAYENVLNDSYNVMKCIQPSTGFILWHDYNGWPGVTKALNEIYEKADNENKYNFIHIEHTSMVLYHADTSKAALNRAKTGFSKQTELDI